MGAGEASEFFKLARLTPRLPVQSMQSPESFIIPTVTETEILKNVGSDQVFMILGF